jgi:DNA repair photolyase
VRLRKVRSRRILTPQSGSGFLDTFTASLNPYAGCSFGAAGGCPYCYVRELPVARFAGAPWGEWVDVKENAPELLERELAVEAARGRLSDQRIFMSSATDPYQGLEGRYKVTRGCLEVMTRFPPGRLVVQTRSPLVLRDVDLLRQIPGAVVSMTLETDDDRVRQAVTPTSPPVERRLAAMRSLADAGIAVYAAVAPVLPCAVDRFPRLLRDAGVQRVILDTMWLGDGAGGRRSARLGMPALMERLGHSGWYGPDAHLPLLRALRATFGEGAVLSQEGFNSV